MLIVHPNPSDPSRISLVLPSLDCGLSVEEIARKDTPAGLPFLIIKDGSPHDMTFLEAFEADFSNPDGYGIGHDAWFAEQAAMGEPK